MALDETGNNQDTDKTKGGQVQTSSSPSSMASGSEKGTSIQPPETFTREMVEKAVSDALAAAGRNTLRLSELQKKIDTEKADLIAKQTAWQKQQEEAEEEAIADDMPALQALRESRRKKAKDEARATELAEQETKLAQREAELAQRAANLADIVEQHRILQRTQLAAEVATEKGVSIDAILKLAKADTREAYEEVAAVLPKGGNSPVLISDSGRTNRGGIDLNALSPRELLTMAYSKKK